MSGASATFGSFALIRQNVFNIKQKHIDPNAVVYTLKENSYNTIKRPKLCSETIRLTARGCTCFLNTSRRYFYGPFWRYPLKCDLFVKWTRFARDKQLRLQRNNIIRVTSYSNVFFSAAYSNLRGALHFSCY